MTVTVYGVGTCEDTAIACDRLRALGVAFEWVDLDEDAAADAWLRGQPGGRRTPTLVVDAGAPVPVPSLDALDALLEGSGRRAALPMPTQFHRPLIDRLVPMQGLPVAGPAGAMPGTMSLEAMRDRSQVALLLAHPPGCRPCAGYAHQLAGAAALLGDVGATPIVVLPARLAGARAWAGEHVPATRVLADERGRYGDRLRAATGLPAAGPALLLLDRYMAPRVGAAGREAGWLPAPGEAVEWLRFLELEGPACLLEVDWPQVPAGRPEDRGA